MNKVVTGCERFKTWVPQTIGGSMIAEAVPAERYDNLEAEAQALREQNTKFQHMLADVVVKHFAENIKRSTAQKSMDVYLSEGIRLLEEERDRIERNRDMWKGQCGRQAEQLEALRTRVVVPEGYALVPIELTRDMWVAVNKEDDKAYAGACDHGAQFDWLWQAAIDAAPRLNSKAVSEGLLRRVCLEAPAVQDIHEQSSWELAHFEAVEELRTLLHP